MFDLRLFVMDGLVGAIGNMPDYKIILNSIGWYEKGVLSDEYMEKIKSLIDQKNNEGVDFE